ncbi:DUF4468 domain-containing protein [Spirosoma aureum]|uniref:DUF4468 domain-containing protein n=1 Tax=Spirosoma aureum TaxID=2692134 RepID=A0A6G9AQS8_9BACT|nr:DUF4468 domain-containing protein [Spirosoma aureum]QIP14760.1 DUF4468 domain-containing protein [Spirosoma aureum]
MKSVFTLIGLVVSIACFGQLNPSPVEMPIDSSSGGIQFREVVTLDPSLDTKAIVQKAKNWVATAYRSANDVVQQFDPETGILIVKGQFPVTRTSYYGNQVTTAAITVYQTLTIEARPGRYRATLNNYEIGAAGQRAVLAANRGSMGRDEYMELVRKQAAGMSMERTIIKSAEKNLDSTITSERLFMADVKQQSLNLLEMLKRHMQKKAEKDW